MNANNIFTIFNQPPDFGSFFIILGNKANSVNGQANAIANPNIPAMGANISPSVEMCTSNVPMMGPVHENDTMTRVKAISKILKSPVVLSALLSVLVLHEAGSVRSKPPKKEMAKNINSTKRNRLNTALVESVLSALEPNNSVSRNPSAT